MKSSTPPFGVVLFAGVLAAGVASSACEASPLPPLVLPAGFHADVFAEKVENLIEA